MAFFKPSEGQNKDVKGEIEKKKLRQQANIFTD